MFLFSVVLDGEFADTKISAENLFSLPICVIMGLHRRAGACSRRNLGHGGTKAPPYKGYGLCPKHL